MQKREKKCVTILQDNKYYNGRSTGYWGRIQGMEIRKIISKMTPVESKPSKEEKIEHSRNHIYRERPRNKRNHRVYSGQAEAKAKPAL